MNTYDKRVLAGVFAFFLLISCIFWGYRSSRSKTPKLDGIEGKFGGKKYRWALATHDGWKKYTHMGEKKKLAAEIIEVDISKKSEEDISKLPRGGMTFFDEAWNTIEEGRKIPMKNDKISPVFPRKFFHEAKWMWFNYKKNKLYYIRIAEASDGAKPSKSFDALQIGRAHV